MAVPCPGRRRGPRRRLRAPLDTGADNLGTPHRLAARAHRRAATPRRARPRLQRRLLVAQLTPTKPTTITERVQTTAAREGEVKSTASRREEQREPGRCDSRRRLHVAATTADKVAATAADQSKPEMRRRGLV